MESIPTAARLFPMIAAAMVFARAAGAAVLPPERDWHRYPANGHFYALIMDLWPWEEARAAAEAMGGHLAVINNAAENRWIFETLLPAAPEGGESGRVWIGLGEDGRWVNGEPVEYRNWAPGEPTGGEGPAHIFKSDGMWNDYPAWRARYFIVEAPADSIFEPRPTPTPAPEPPGWLDPRYTWFYNPDTRHHYAISYELHEWNDSQKIAVSLGGHLVAINDAAENRWLEETVLPHAPGGERGGRLWIGMDANLNWVSGNETRFANWAGGYPPEPGTAPVCIHKRDGTWGLMENTLYRPSIIEVSKELPVTPVPSPFPSNTPTPTPTPAPNRPEDALYSNALDRRGGERGNRMQILTPAGHKPGGVEFGAVPPHLSEDGLGMIVPLAPGQGVFALSVPRVPVEGSARVSVNAWCSSSLVSLAAVALNDPIDGQYGYHLVGGPAAPVFGHGLIELVYTPPSGSMRIAIQAVHSPLASLPATVWIDGFWAEPADAPAGTPLPLFTDGSFDQGFDGLETNINGVSGRTEAFFETQFTDLAVRLTAGPDNAAANVATHVLQHSEPAAPFEALAMVDARREGTEAPGTLMLVLTNDRHTLGMTRNVAALPADADSPETLAVGGWMYSVNPVVPPTVAAQYLSGNGRASVVIDDLRVVGR